MARRAPHSAGWFLAALGIAAALAYATFVGSLLNSCGAGDSGPNPGAEADFCGYGPGEPTDYSTLFLVVNLLVPLVPVLIGGLLPVLGHSRLFFGAGVALGVLATGLIWTLEP
ncbi:MAG TPA: hypothetical protein VNB86_02260 [Gaiellaceae bacterium]|jgi:hypothetical protein|nr:hypothetical protein [Gaiellaceae bacterium]